MTNLHPGLVGEGAVACCDPEKPLGVHGGAYMMTSAAAAMSSCVDFLPLFACSSLCILFRACCWEDRFSSRLLSAARLESASPGVGAFADARGALAGEGGREGTRLGPNPKPEPAAMQRAAPPLRKEVRPRGVAVADSAMDS